MKTAIMQPYIFPYIGYFQLINAVDTFVIYDEIEYTKKGWINRNKFLNNQPIILPLKKDSDFLSINQRIICKTDKLFTKSLSSIKNTYFKAPYFNNVYPVVLNCFNDNSDNLFEFIYNSILNVCEYLDINTNIIISSTLATDKKLKSQEKIIAISKELNSNSYINAIGGMELYNKDDFIEEGISLSFLKTQDFNYKQFNSNFQSYLSIIDVLMFNSKDEVKELLEKYELV